jgi:hypothetical protein
MTSTTDADKEVESLFNNIGFKKAPDPFICLVVVLHEALPALLILRLGGEGEPFFAVGPASHPREPGGHLYRWHFKWWADKPSAA